MLMETEEKAQIISDLIARLKEKYIFPDMADQIADDLQDRLLAGEYDDIAKGRFFAYALTTHMQEISQDEHLWVRWYPNPLPDHEGSLLQNEEKLAEMKLSARLKNYGFSRVERLPGNVGYLEIQYFYRPSWGSADTATGAMSFLANSDTLIIDLRQCQGGNPDMVALMTSYFFDGEPIHLNSLYWRDEDFTQQYWTHPHVEGKRLNQTPIFLLINEVTFSAGEEFAYNLKALKRATLVGKATSGGAHPGSPFRLHPHFEVFIPLGQSINPVTNSNWEGTGVIPDIDADSNTAYYLAYKLALEKVIEKHEQAEEAPNKKLLKEAKTALQDLTDILE